MYYYYRLWAQKKYFPSNSVARKFIRFFPTAVVMYLMKSIKRQTL